jgi:hypothetical protein
MFHTLDSKSSDMAPSPKIHHVVVSKLANVIVLVKGRGLVLRRQLIVTQDTSKVGTGQRAGLALLFTHGVPRVLL